MKYKISFEKNVRVGDISPQDCLDNNDIADKVVSTLTINLNLVERIYEIKGDDGKTKEIIFDFGGSYDRDIIRITNTMLNENEFNALSTAIGDIPSKMSF